jgi:hypothetical protein
LLHGEFREEDLVTPIYVLGQCSVLSLLLGFFGAVLLSLSLLLGFFGAVLLSLSLLLGFFGAVLRSRQFQF